MDSPLGGARPAHHVDQIDRVAHLGDARAAHDAVEGAGDVLRGHAELAGLVLEHVDLHHARRLVPVEADVADPGVLAHESRELLRQLPHLLDVGPAEPVLHRASGRRTHRQQVHVHIQAGKFLPGPES